MTRFPAACLLMLLLASVPRLGMANPTGPDKMTGVYWIGFTLYSNAPTNYPYNSATAVQLPTGKDYMPMAASFVGSGHPLCKTVHYVTKELVNNGTTPGRYDVGFNQWPTYPLLAKYHWSFWVEPTDCRGVVLIEP